MINLRFPDISGKTHEEKIDQIQSYLHQLVEQLNWAFSVLESNENQE